MHRNTYLVVSVLAVLAALVVGVNVGKKISPAPAAPTPAITNAPTPLPQLQTFTDTACGFSVTYENSYTLMENASGSAILNHAEDKTKSIVMTCQKDIPRPALSPENIETLSLLTPDGSSVSAKIYHNQSAKDGTPIDAVIFTHPTSNLDVFIAGYGEGFNTLIKTIRILP
jgi:hypothetical protein